MSSSILYMSMSLDGFIAGPDDDDERGLGVDGEVLHEWLGEWDEAGPTPSFQPPGESATVYDEMMETGAVVVGRRTFDIAGHWGGDHHGGVPIFVPTRGEPPEAEAETIHYVTDDAGSAMRQAKEAAGEANVMVHGADLAQSLLREGALDELEIHLVPILLGEGRRLFEHLGTDHTELEMTRVLQAPGVVHLHYRVAG